MASRRQQQQQESGGGARNRCPAHSVPIKRTSSPCCPGHCANSVPPLVCCADSCWRLVSLATFPPANPNERDGGRRAGRPCKLQLLTQAHTHWDRRRRTERMSQCFADRRTSDCSEAHRRTDARTRRTSERTNERTNLIRCRFLAKVRFLSF